MYVMYVMYVILYASYTSYKPGAETMVSVADTDTSCPFLPGTNSETSVS
jgi:hypothetical protein